VRKKRTRQGTLTLGGMGTLSSCERNKDTRTEGIRTRKKTDLNSDDRRETRKGAKANMKVTKRAGRWERAATGKTVGSGEECGLERASRHR